MMTSNILQMKIVFYSTKDVKERLRIKSTQTLKAYRDKKGFPNPVISGNGSHALYSVKEVQLWEQEQIFGLVG